MSELILYDFGNSVCCQKVRITLRAKALEWRAIRVDLFTAAQYDPEYLKLNPKGVVPTLVHDGKPVIESTLICEYIDAAFPHPPKLIPADPWLQSRMRLWSKMVDEGLFEGVTEISFSAMFRERMKTMPEETRQKRFRNVGDPRRTDRFKSTYEYGVQSPFVVHAIAAYERGFKMLEIMLAEHGGPWILGGNPSLADINLMPFAARLDYLRGLSTCGPAAGRTCRTGGSMRRLGRSSSPDFTISSQNMNSPKCARTAQKSVTASPLTWQR